MKLFDKLKGKKTSAEKLEVILKNARELCRKGFFSSEVNTAVGVALTILKEGNLNDESSLNLAKGVYNYITNMFMDSSNLAYSGYTINIDIKASFGDSINKELEEFPDQIYTLDEWKRTFAAYQKVDIIDVSSFQKTDNGTDIYKKMLSFLEKFIKQNLPVNANDVNNNPNLNNNNNNYHDDNQDDDNNDPAAPVAPF